MPIALSVCFWWGKSDFSEELPFATCEAILIILEGLGLKGGIEINRERVDPQRRYKLRPDDVVVTMKFIVNKYVV